MWTNITTAAGVLLMGLIGLFAGIGGAEVLDTTFSPPKPYALIVNDLSFKNGLISQSHRVIGRQAIRADWSAKIMRGDRVLCYGGGDGVYQDSKRATMPPSAWTGGDCPELLPGDVATAVWEYKTVDGQIEQITRSVTIEDEIL